MIYNDRVDVYYITKDDIDNMADNIKGLINEFIDGIGEEHKKCFKEVYYYNKYHSLDETFPCYSPADEYNYSYTKRIIQNNIRETHYELTKRYKEYDKENPKWEVEIKRVSPRNGTDIIILVDVQSCKYFAELLGVDL